MNSVYRIKGRCLDGVKVMAYVIEDTTTRVARVVSKEETEYLTMNKRIENCYGQTYNGKVILKGVKCKLVDFPNYTLSGEIVKKETSDNNKKKAHLRIKARIVSGKHTIGYIVYWIGNNGEQLEKQIKREQTLILAREGKIANARVQMFNDKLLLRGVNCELAQLPVVREV